MSYRTRRVHAIKSTPCIRARVQPQQDALAKANSVAGQILSLIRVVRSHGSEERELHRYGVELRNTVNMLETHDLGHSIYRSVVRLLQTFLQASQRIVGFVGGD